jgi:Zinc-binding dehydrogenase
MAAARSSGWRRANTSDVHARRLRARSAALRPDPRHRRDRARSACKRVLEPRGTVVVVGGPKRNRVIGPLGHMLGMRAASFGSGHKVAFFLAQVNKADLEALGELLAAGAVTPVVDRRYEIADIVDAFRYLGEGQAHTPVTSAPNDLATCTANVPTPPSVTTPAGRGTSTNSSTSGSRSCDGRSPSSWSSGRCLRVLRAAIRPRRQQRRTARSHPRRSRAGAQRREGGRSRRLSRRPAT